MPTTISNGSAIALEGWGNFHLRGRIVNLGQVLLGGAAEKIAPTSDNMDYGDYTEEKGVKKFYATTFNSPFSITSQYTKRDSTDIKRVQGAFWPLYFHSEALKSYEEGSYKPGWDNRGWVCLSSGEVDMDQTNDYTLQFATRQKVDGEEGQVSAVVPDGIKEKVALSAITNWRIDSNGMWADAILLRRNIGTTNFPKISNGQMMEKAEGLFGFLYGDDETEETINIGLKNMSSDAPSVVIETPRNIRLSTGMSPYQTTKTDMAIYLNAGLNGKITSSLVLHGYNSIATMDAGIIILGPGREGDKNVEKGLHIRTPYIKVETTADKQEGIYARFG